MTTCAWCTGGGALVAVEHRLCGIEELAADECLVGRLIRRDPLVGVVPAHLGDVPERNVIDVDEDLVFALLVPHLEAGVAGVGEDGPDC